MAEKTPEPPMYKVTETDQATRGNKPKLLLGLMFYAGAMTAAVVVICVLGAIYRQDMLATPKGADPSTGENTKHYDMSDDKTTGDVDVDLKRNREIIHQKDANGSRSSTTVLDFGENIGGVWMEDQNACFLFDDLEQLPNPQDLERFFEDDESKADERSTGTEVDFVPDYNSPVTDHSVVPPELLTKCWGKPMYWTTRAQPNNGERHARASYYCVRVWRLIGCDSVYCYYRITTICYRL